MSLLVLVGCAERTQSISQEINPKPLMFSFPQQVADLEGPWQYQDAEGEGTMTLDAKGNGSYDWEDGRFQTLSLENGMWTGVWIQEGNDREGGFKLIFSHNKREAQGKWWYTRIGKDQEPLQPGGTFKMVRSSSFQLGQ